MGTRGQHGQDTIQRMIQETEEQKKYELEQQNNTYLNKAIKSLPISDIAAHASRPEQVIGLHFFSPVEKMPLVEIIPHAGTSAQTIATTVKLCGSYFRGNATLRDRRRPVCFSRRGPPCRNIGAPNAGKAWRPRPRNRQRLPHGAPDPAQM